MNDRYFEAQMEQASEGKIFTEADNKELTLMAFRGMDKNREVFELWQNQELDYYPANSFPFSQKYSRVEGEFDLPEIPNKTCVINGVYVCERKKHNSGNWHTKTTLSCEVLGKGQYTFAQDFVQETRPLADLIAEFNAKLIEMSEIL